MEYKRTNEFGRGGFRTTDDQAEYKIRGGNGMKTMFMHYAQSQGVSAGEIGDYGVGIKGSTVFVENFETDEEVEREVSDVSEALTFILEQTGCDSIVHIEIIRTQSGPSWDIIGQHVTVLSGKDVETYKVISNPVADESIVINERTGAVGTRKIMGIEALKDFFSKEEWPC